MGRFSIVLVFFMWFQLHLNGQPDPSKSLFRSPMDIPLLLSGNYGEIRANHFHSGIDIKTGGALGQKVYVIADGYISRIKIETGGYGNSVYINHPSGYTSVYAHLSGYNALIDNYVKTYQYKNKTHTVDLYPSAGQMPVKKGDLLAFSGNSGSSGGPHLHFELRDVKNQNPVNVLLFGFNVIDNIKPVITNIVLYPLDNESSINGACEKFIIPVIGNNGVFHINGIPKVWGNIGIGIEAFDYLNNSSNKCGIYSIQLTMNDKEIYFYKLDEFSFAESRYINAHMDYELYKQKNMKIQRSYLLPNNQLGMYKNMINDGKIEANGAGELKFDYTINDSYGNTSKLPFSLEMTKPEKITSSLKPKNVISYFSYKTDNKYTNSDITLIIPSYSLYDNLDFTYSASPSKPGTYSLLHHIQSEDVPLQKYISLAVKTHGIPYELEEKAVLVQLDENNRFSSVGGSFKKGYLHARTRSFGTFAVMVDTISPSIKPMNISSGANLSGKKSISFRISDNLSGIKSYNGFIDNEWVLFEYDPKNNLLEYTFDKRHLQSEKPHELELFIKDERENISVFQCDFRW